MGKISYTLTKKSLKRCPSSRAKKIFFEWGHKRYRTKEMTLGLGVVANIHNVSIWQAETSRLEAGLGYTKGVSLKTMILDIEMNIMSQ